MEKLHEIKQNYAKGQGFDSFEIMRQEQGIDNLDLNIICKEYATECVKASLEKASENCYAKEIYGLCFNDNVNIEKSITQESNIVLL